MTRRRWITTVLTLLAGAFAVRFGLIFPWARTLDMLAASDWLLLTAAGVINIISLSAKGAAWHLLLRRLGPVRFATTQFATFLGAAVNSISVSVSGEAVRAHLAAVRDGVSFGAAATSLIVTRLVEALGLVVFLALAFILLPAWPEARAVGVALGAAAGAVTLGYYLVPWSQLHSRALGRWHETFVRMAAAKHRGGLASAVAFTTLSWLGQWLTYHWSIAATHVAVTPAVSLTALVVANIAGILRLTPGNIGVMQGSLILGMRAFEIPATDALAAGLALQAIEVLPVLVIGMGVAGAGRFRRLAIRSEAV